MFSQWGLDVQGIDPSDEMLEGARHNAREAGADLAFSQGGFGDVAETIGAVDAAVSLGNALPHVPDIEALTEAFQDFAEAVRPGGVLILHFLNHDRIDEHDVRLLPPVFRTMPEGDNVFVRVIDHADDHYEFEFASLTRAPRPDGMDGGEPSDWTLEPRRSRHTKLLGETVRRELSAAGFTDIRALGDHTGRELDAGADESVIWVATRS
jgi:SAM-dependent methyltransferase